MKGAPGNYVANQQFTILTATGGIDGQYQTVTDDLPLLNVRVIYNDYEILLLLIGNGSRFGDVAENFNQSQVADALTVIEPTASGGMQMLIDELTLQNTAGVRRGLQSLAAELYGSTATLKIEATDLYVRSTVNYLRQRSGLPAEFTSFSSARDASAGMYAAAGPLTTSSEIQRVSSGLATSDRVDAVRRPIGRTVCDCGCAGNEFYSYVESGLNIPVGCWNVQPIAGVRYILLGQNDFAEAGATAANLNVASATFDSLRYSLGARLSRPFITDWGFWSPYVQGRWSHEMLDDERLIASSFAAAPVGTFVSRGNVLGRDFGEFGAGVATSLTENVNLYVGYDAQVSNRQSAHGGAGGLQILR